MSDNADLIGLDELPEDARAVVDAAERAVAEVRERAERQTAALREAADRECDAIRARAESELAAVQQNTTRELAPLVRGLLDQLRALQQRYAREGLLDEALAIRARVRQLRGDLLGVRPDPGTLSEFSTADVGRTALIEVVGRADGSAWGTDVYTSDSRLATAAVHAGLVRRGRAADWSASRSSTVRSAPMSVASATAWQPSTTRTTRSRTASRRYDPPRLAGVRCRHRCPTGTTIPRGSSPPTSSTRTATRTAPHSSACRSRSRALEASGLGRSLEADELRKKERAFLGPFSVYPHLWAAEECAELVRVIPPVRTSSPLVSLHVEGAKIGCTGTADSWVRLLAPRPSGCGTGSRCGHATRCGGLHSPSVRRTATCGTPVSARSAGCSKCGCTEGSVIPTRPRISSPGFGGGSPGARVEWSPF